MEGESTLSLALLIPPLATLIFQKSLEGFFLEGRALVFKGWGCVEGWTTYKGCKEHVTQGFRVSAETPALDLSCVRVVHPPE